MKISIELFLIDNTVMNYAIFACAGAIGGIPLKQGRLWLFSLFGAVYALFSLFYIPILMHPALKLIFFFLLGMPFVGCGRGYFKGTLLVLISACLIGGIVTFLCTQLGGMRTEDGAWIGTPSLRIALLSVCLALSMPRWVRSVLIRRETETRKVAVKIRHDDIAYVAEGFVDTGNLVCEPISGLPVVLVERSVCGDHPIPIRTASGEAVLWAKRGSILFLQIAPTEIDCFFATAPHIANAGNAIIPSTILPYRWRCSHVREAAYPVFAAVVRFRIWQKQFLLVHSYKRKPAKAAFRRGGGILHRSCGGGADCKRKADRA